jgi:predicted Zn-dependent protease
VSDVLNLTRQAAKAADDVGQDLLALDLDQEHDTGREVHRMILKDHAILQLPELQSRVERLAQPLLDLCKRKGLTYTFFVIDDKAINAFSHLGAYIYIHKGFLDFAASDVELQYAIGHEIAHVELKHCLRNPTYSARLSKWTPGAAGGIAQLAYNMTALGYSEGFEFEADEWSFRSQIRLGYSPEQATSFARHSLDYLTSRGIQTESRRPESVSDAVVRKVENHFRSHPAAKERLRRLEKLSTNIDKPRN